MMTGAIFELPSKKVLKYVQGVFVILTLFLLVLFGYEEISKFLATPKEDCIERNLEHANAGYVSAMRSMGGCYWKEREEANKWYLRAAERGDRFSQEQLYFYFRGDWKNAPDYEQAYFWFLQYHAKSKKNTSTFDADSAQLTTHLSTKQKGAIEEKVKNWIPTAGLQGQPPISAPARYWTSAKEGLSFIFGIPLFVIAMTRSVFMIPGMAIIINWTIKTFSETKWAKARRQYLQTLGHLLCFAILCTAVLYTYYDGMNRIEGCSLPDAKIYRGISVFPSCPWLPQSFYILIIFYAAGAATVCAGAIALYKRDLKTFLPSLIVQMRGWESLAISYILFRHWDKAFCSINTCYL